MRRPFAVVLLAGAGLACPAAAAERVDVRLLARPAATVGVAWSATLAVSPASAGRPTVVARRGRSARTGGVTETGNGRYRLRLTFPTAGRWRLEARLRGSTFDLGAVTAAPGRAVADVTEPFAVAIAANGDVVVADRGGNRVVRIDPKTARLAVVARLREPLALALDRGGNVYVVSEERIRRVDAATGSVSTIAGTGARGHGGDDRPAAGGPLDAPIGIAFDDSGNLFVAEYENRVRRIDAATGLISAVAGNGTEGFRGDGGPARSALVSHPHGLTVLPDGSVVVADSWNNRLRRIDATTRRISTIAGTGVKGFAGDGGPALRAVFDAPVDVAAGPDGTLFVADGNNGRIRRIAPDGTIRTVAPRASLGLPNHVAVARDGSLYASDFEGRRVLRIDPRTGSVSTLAR